MCAWCELTSCVVVVFLCFVVGCCFCLSVNLTYVAPELPAITLHVPAGSSDEIKLPVGIDGVVCPRSVRRQGILFKISVQQRNVIVKKEGSDQLDYYDFGIKCGRPGVSLAGWWRADIRVALNTNNSIPKLFEVKI